MLTRLRIKNFQNHKKIDIEFDKGVTTIIGPSDAGKSALLRALSWVVFNRPVGTEFIREGQKGCTVRIETSSHKITRTRGKENTYHLDGKEYRAFGNDVPESIQNVLQLGEINFQSQHDAPFWLSESAAQVSRNLNQIVDLGIIDAALAQTSKTMRKAKWEAESTKERFLHYRKQKEDLAWVVEANGELVDLEAGAAALEASTESQIRLEALTHDASRYSKEVEQDRKLVADITALQKSVETIIDHDYYVRRLRSYTDDLISETEVLAKRKERANEIQQELETYEVCPTCQRPM